MTDLKTITTQIAEALNSTINPDNPAQVRYKINRLTLMLAASCQAVAWSQQLYHNKMAVLAHQNLNTGASATEKKLLLAGSVRHEAYYLTLAERQNKALVHALDALRMLLLS